MSHAAMLLIALATFVFGIFVWGCVFAVSAQNTSVIYEDCDGTSGSNIKNMTCTGSNHESIGVTLADTVMKTMNLYSHNTNIPFLLPFP
jgi:hypothetical protein